MTEIKAALEADEQSRGIGVPPLVLMCVCRGVRSLTSDGVEERPPGIYYENPATRSGPTIVFEGSEPPPELIAKFKPKGGGGGPLIVVMGPDFVEPPAEEPTDL